MPATLVEIGLKLLLGLGSQVSMWLGPPSSQNRMTEVALPWTGALAAFRYSLSVRPRNPREPTLRKSLRVVGWVGILPPIVLVFISVQAPLHDCRGSEAERCLNLDRASI